MRNLVDVIGKMIEVIPADDVKNIELLKDNMDSVMYSAPEVIPDWWNIVASSVEIIVGSELDTEWKQLLVDIWMDKK